MNTKQKDGLIKKLCTENDRLRVANAYKDKMYKLLEWLNDPVLWVQEFIGIDLFKYVNPGPAQECWEFAKCCEAGVKEFSIKEDERNGALMILWFFMLHKNAKIIILGESYDHMKETIWAEIINWIGYAKEMLGDKSLFEDFLEIQSERIYCTHVPKAHLGKLWTIQMLTYPKNGSIIDQKSCLLGFHCNINLLIVDTGVPDYIHEIAKQNLLPPNHGRGTHMLLKIGENK